MLLKIARYRFPQNAEKWVETHFLLGLSHRRGEVLSRSWKRRRKRMLGWASQLRESTAVMS